MSYNYGLHAKILQSDEALTLCRSDKVLVEIDKNTLALAIENHDRTEGYVFFGHGKLLIDTIVETEKGAFGKPVQQELKEPFLMLGTVEEQSKHLATVDGDSLKRMGVDQKDYLDKAQRLLDRFTSKRGFHRHERSNTRSGGSIFAFQNDGDTLDMLVVEDSRMVYAAKDLSYVSSGDRSVLTSSGQVVLSSTGKHPFPGRAFTNHHCRH